jgi:hypothetical protein
MNMKKADEAAISELIMNRADFIEKSSMDDQLLSY